MFRLLQLIVLGSVVAWPALSVSAEPVSAQRPPSCDGRGRTEVANREVRVYRVGPSERTMYFPQYYGCYRRTGRTWSLGEFGGSEVIVALRLAGRYLAYDIEDCTGGPCWGDLVVRDLARGTAKTNKWPSHARPVTDLELKANGSVAWIRHEPIAGPRQDPVFPAQYTFRVHKRESSGYYRLLGTGNDIDPRSLVLLDGRRLRWTKAGKAVYGLLR